MEIFRLLLRTLWVAAGLLVAVPAMAAVVAQEGFDYGAGDLNGQNGGTGDWKDSWSSDSELDIVLGTYTYTDSLGNQLDTTGGHVELDSDPGGFKRASRSMNDKVGTTNETFWFGAILNGSAASSVNNIGLGDGLFFGQGTKDSGTTTWGLSDRDGLIADTGISANALSFLIVRVDFTGGDENVWLWVNPILTSTPLTSSADASGTAKDFEADFLLAQLESFGASGFDEIRLGDTFLDAAPYIPALPIPEQGTHLLLGLGLIGLAISQRETMRYWPSSVSATEYGVRTQAMRQ